MEKFWIWLDAQDFRFSAWIFLRGMGLIYLIAFASLSVQIKGLIGSNGILPISDFFASYGCRIPSLLCFNQSDDFMMILVYAGIGFSILQIANIAPKICLISLWTLYLSFVNAGQDFMSFQWDVLLLEAGFLAIFLAPFWENPFRIAQSSPNRLILWLLRWLLFRLMFASGILKILAGDPTWTNFTAMVYHYETQPLPSPLAYYIEQLPLIFHQFSSLMVYFIEILVPFCFFMPQRVRHFGSTITIGLQVLIMLTGNFAFFNWLTIVLCIPLLDDSFWHWNKADAKENKIWQKVLTTIAALLLFLIGTWAFMRQFRLLRMPEPFAPYHIANRYGLFVSMTTEHPLLIIEGSYDGENWQEYRLRWQPQDIDEMPPIVAPHQPRLDWQLWFAALGDIQQNRWLLALVGALERGSPDVLALFESSPFPADKPPTYIRITLYDYRFGRETWWERTYIGEYFINR